MKKLELLVPPPVIAALLAGLMWLIVPRVPMISQLPDHHLVLCGIAALAGIVSALAGVIVVMMNKTTINPHAPQKTSRLVKSGVYRYTRNPMYVGIMLVLASWALYLSHILPLLLLPVFLFYMNRFQVIPEEQILEQHFGDEYVNYKHRVRRWL
ncbi:MAG: isoprenylcysteine carboxylmethyltransferase family protein [Oceanobacter sp.]|jgi:protein-S-isoprenylcysteine O-methyltransferase Ste14